MISKEAVVKEIEKLPPHLLEEVAEYIDFIKYKKSKNKNLEIDDITLASEESLAKDWLRPEDDEAWKNL